MNECYRVLLISVLLLQANAAFAADALTPANQNNLQIVQSSQSDLALQALLESGDIHLNSRQFNDAIAKFDEALLIVDTALKSDSDNFKLLIAKGNAEMGKGRGEAALQNHDAAATNYKRSEDAFKAALITKPDDLSAMMGQALCVSRQSILEAPFLPDEQALQILDSSMQGLDEILKIEPKSHEILYLKTVAMLTKGRLLFLSKSYAYSEATMEEDLTAIGEFLKAGGDEVRCSEIKAHALFFLCRLQIHADRLSAETVESAISAADTNINLWPKQSSSYALKASLMLALSSDEYVRGIGDNGVSKKNKAMRAFEQAVSCSDCTPQIKETFAKLRSQKPVSESKLRHDALKQIRNELTSPSHGGGSLRPGET